MGDEATRPGVDLGNSTVDAIRYACTLFAFAVRRAARMPRKIRELIRDLLDAGFEKRRGKGSHRNYSHPALAEVVTISGRDGDDARRHLEKQV